MHAGRQAGMHVCNENKKTLRATNTRGQRTLPLGAVQKSGGIKYPVIQGGMHYVGYAEMAAAVSNAGGLGVITALTVAQPPKGKEALREEIQKCRKLTDKPFGVNITLLPVGVPPDYEGIIQVLVEEGIKVVETAGRNPEQVIKTLKSHGMFVIHKCVAVRHAQTAARMGADFISMDGFDCGGHPGEEDVGNWVLLAGCPGVEDPLRG